MRILERPTVVQCKSCGVDIKVGTRGPIPQLCPEHRGLTSKKQKKPPARVELPRKEIHRLRQGYADAIALQLAAKNALIEERAAHARTKELLRDLQIHHNEVKQELRHLQDADDDEGGPVYDPVDPLSEGPASVVDHLHEGDAPANLKPSGIYQLDESVPAPEVEMIASPEPPQHEQGFE